MLPSTMVRLIDSRELKELSKAAETSFNEKAGKFKLNLPSYCDAEDGKFLNAGQGREAAPRRRGHLVNSLKAIESNQ